MPILRMLWERGRERDGGIDRNKQIQLRGLYSGDFNLQGSSRHAWAFMPRKNRQGR